MAEYAGYVASPNQFDWGQFSSDLASNKIAIAEKVRAERQKKKEAFEKKSQDIYADIKAPEKVYNQTLNDFFTQGTIEGKNKFIEFTGKTDYNLTNTAQLTRKQTNIKNYIAQLGEVAKDIKANEAKILDPKFQETQSDLGRNFSKLFITISDVSDKKNFFDDDGYGYMQQVDANGNPTSDVKINPILLKSTQGFTDGSIDYDKQLNDFVANQVGEYKKATLLGSGSVKTTESVADNPFFKDAKAKLVTSLTANDRESARFLTSTSGYASYVENDLRQKQTLLNNGIPEDKLIPVGLGEDGLPTAKLTPEQRKAAVNLANIKIDQRVGVVETLTKPAGSGSTSAPKPTEGSKARESALNTAISYAEILQKDPKNGFVINKIKDAYRSLGFPVEIVTLKDPNTNEIYGYDVFKIKDGKRVKTPQSEGGAPSGAYIRKGGAVQGLFEMLNKDQKRGEEGIDWGTAVGEYKGDQSRLSERLPLLLGKSNTTQQSAPKPAKNTGKVVTLATMKEKLGGNPTKEQLDSYRKQLIKQGFNPEQ